MAEVRLASAAGSEDVEVFLSASEDEAAQQQQVVTPELLSALVKQVEFYFSDANLPTDKKLLKQIRKDPEGFVPVKLFANFRKVRALSKDVGIITEALRGACLLQLSQDCKRVKRIVPVPEYDISDIQRRTIVVENLPGNPSPTIESVTDMFRIYGRVKLVRICSRESKGKLPSWLTGSCQNMNGQQHAYVEFEEEEGAILAAAALAQESDAPDGAVQVRRLLACIAEQRERRSGNGNGSSYGGSTSGGGGCSRKGSRDVSPMGHSRRTEANAASRRNSGGGAPYGNSHSCGGSAWGACSISAGGAAPLDHHAAFHNPYHYHSYGGAYEHAGVVGAASRRGSGGGAMSPALAHLPPPPPPPPPRRSCDSAPASDLLPPSAIPTPTLSARSANVYRPPAKRMSDGYGSTIMSSAQAAASGAATPASPSAAAGAAVPAPAPVTAPPTLISRSLGGSFNSSCGGTSCSTSGMSTASVCSTAPVSTASTPVGVPSSPPLAMAPSLSYMVSSSYVCPSSGVTLVAHSPPLSSRGVSIGGGRPPVHPPPPACPPSQLTCPLSAGTGPISAAGATTSLAEAIAQLQAERRASEAGAKASSSEQGPSKVLSVVVPPAPTAPATPLVNPSTPAGAPPPPPPPALPSISASAACVPPAGAAAASAPSLKSTAPTAPKFCLDLAAGPAPHHGPSRTRISPTGSLADPSSSRLAVSSGGSVSGASGLQQHPSGNESASSVGGTRGSQGQMVENVEDFINNILARPAARPVPVSAAATTICTAATAAASSAAAVPSRKSVAPVAAPRSAAVATSSTSSEAAAAVAGILASALRRPPVTSVAMSAPCATATIVLGSSRSNSGKPAAEETKAKAASALPRALVHITAIAAADCDMVEESTAELHDLDLNGKRLDLELDLKLVSPAKAVAELPQLPVPLTQPAAAPGRQGFSGVESPSKNSSSSAVPSSPPVSNRSTGSYAAPKSNGNTKVAGDRRTSAAGPQPGSKRLSKRDYANWAAATPGFRAEAASKYGVGAGTAVSASSSPAPASAPSAGTQSPAQSAGGSRASAGGLAAPAELVAVCGSGGSSGGGFSAAPQPHSAPAGPIWHVARGPDGSRGFTGRSRASAVSAM